MYQPYPSGVQESRSASAPPSSILTAVKVMYVGAAFSAIGVILTLVTVGSVRTAIHKAHPLLSAARVHSLGNFDAISAVVIGVIAMGLWLWMAFANKAGGSWARVTASVIFGLNTLAALVVVSRPEAVLNKLAAIVIWLAGLAVIVLLWQRKSSNFYDSRTRVS
jgi:hypothetical protein